MNQELTKVSVATIKECCDLRGQPTLPCEHRLHSYCLTDEKIRGDYARIPLSSIKTGGNDVTKQREGLFTTVKWLSKLMSGEVACQWPFWFKTHYTGYATIPPDSGLAKWNMDHTLLLDELCRERLLLCETTFRETQNDFKVRLRMGITISGKPDLVAMNAKGDCTIWDCKTGIARTSDVVQVMLYMMFLPYGKKFYQGKELSGCLIYKNGNKMPIPSGMIDDGFKSNIKHFLDGLNSATPLQKAPHPSECLYCDLTKDDCPDRIDQTEKLAAIEESNPPF